MNPTNTQEQICQRQYEEMAKRVRKYNRASIVVMACIVLSVLLDVGVLLLFLWPALTGGSMVGVGLFVANILIFGSPIWFALACATIVCLCAKRYYYVQHYGTTSSSGVMLALKIVGVIILNLPLFAIVLLML